MQPVTGRSGGPDNFNYTFKDSDTVGGPTYDWIEISGTGNLTLNNSDDSVQDNVNLGFFFNYYGTDYSRLAIANNGLLFSTGTTTQYVNEPIGQSPGVHGFIAPFWDDIVTWNGGKIYYQTLGTAPNRIFVTEWVDNQHYDYSDSGITFKSILYEGSNNVKFLYKDVVFGNVSGATSNDKLPYDNGGSATVGIESPDGTDGLQYSYNEQVIDPGKAILFKFPQYEGTNLYISQNAPINKDHGSSMTYTLYYHNFGNAVAQNVVLKDELASNIEFESASNGGLYNPSTRTVSWDIGSVESEGNGYRTITVKVPQDVPVETVIPNKASISTSNLEIRYDDNEAYAQTRITGSTLPPNVGVEPNYGGTGMTSVYYHNPITFSYHSAQPATAVNIKIHIDDSGPDITDNMIATSGSTTGSTSDWTYTTTFYPRYGSSTVTYTIQSDIAPYSTGYDVRSSVGNLITASDIEKYIEINYPTSPMLGEPNIGSSFINAGKVYGIDPAFLVGLAEEEGRFGTAGWGASHPEAHNTFGYGVPSGTTPVNSINSASSWRAMVNRVANSIANGPNYFKAGRYTVEQIRDKYAANPNPQAIVKFMNQLYALSMNRHSTISFNIYIDPAGYIYDVDTGNRIAGASVWLQRPDSSGDWENVTTGENPPISQPDINPLTSDQYGMYQWDVLNGSYRVHVEAPGYEPNNSIVVSIPPPVTDLHVGLHHINDPNVPPILPVANFSTDISSGYAPLTVQFTDLSENSTGVSWDFGDGTNSTDRYPPVHIYSIPKIYNVKLTASNGNGVNSTTRMITVQEVPIYPVANFSSTVTEGYTPLSVQFTDLSENEAVRNWDLGDGTNSSDQSPLHTYSVAGNYIVTLTVSNDNAQIQVLLE